MEKRRRTILAAGLAAAAVLLCLVGCGRHPSESPGQQVSWKKTVTVGTDGPLKTTDPQKISNAAHDQLFQMMYNRLLHRNAETGELEPELAREWEWADESLSVIRIRLRDDVYFHSGAKLTAADVAFTMDRITNSTVKGSYDRCEVLGDYELLIYLTGTNTDFPYHLAACTTSVVSKAAAEADPEADACCGSGPWKYVPEESAAGDHVTLVRFENSWQEKPVTEKMLLRYIGSDSARLMALENKEIDLAVTLSYQELEAAQKNRDLDVQVYVGTGLNYLAFNTCSEAGGNEKLRRAVAYALDREAMIRAVGDPAGEAAVSLFARGASAYRTDFETDMSCQPERAASLAAELGDDAAFRLTVNTTLQSYKTMAEVLQEQCRLAGIRVTLDEVDASGLTAASKFSSATHEALIYTIYLNEYNSDISRLLTPGISTNKAVLTDGEVLGLLEQGVTVGDAAAARDCYRKVQELVHDHCWYIPLFYGSGAVAWQKGTEGCIVADNARHDFTYLRAAE